MKKIALIGSCGSIGRQVLKVVENHCDEYEIVALASGSNKKLFEEQVRKFSPKIYALSSKDREGALAVSDFAEADIVFNAATGFAGLEYSLRAVAAGKTLALANKESLICGGELLKKLLKNSESEIIPVDSEHSAIWQCLAFERHAKLRRLIITASGGAFKGVPFEDLKGVTASAALNHPTWKMGRKITVDSATLMNKGYEIIEAHFLFGTPYSNIEAVIQPTSIIHSLVEFDDGALLAELSYPTMEIPIQLALSFPERLKTEVKPMDFKRAFSIPFEPLNEEDYPCFALALECGRAGGVSPLVLNAADEVAVNAFLDGRIAYTDIYKVVRNTLDKVGGSAESFEELTLADGKARAAAKKIIGL